MPDFSTIRREIAGLPIADLARRFGTPTYIYDAARIIERIHDLRQFDYVRYAQKACSNLAVLDLIRRQGVLVDAVSAGEIRRALAAGYQPHAEPARTSARSAPANRLHGRHLRPRNARSGRLSGPPRQLRLARHARSTRRAGPRQPDHPPHQSGLRPRPQPKDEHRRRAIETRHLARRPDRLPPPRRSPRPGSRRAAHAYRLGHRSGPSAAGLRCARADRPRSRPLADDDQRRGRPAGALSGRRGLCRSGGLLRTLGRRASPAGR